MARKDYFVAKDTPHPLYRTRMLTAGVPIPLDLSAARLYGKLGVQLSEEAPRRAAPKPAGESAVAMATRATEAATPAPKKPAPKRKKAAAKKK